MEYRDLGRTGLSVSFLGFGASPLGNVFGQVEHSAALDAVSSALTHGINFFDVSPYYGSTLAEERLGTALAGRRHEVLLATKCGRYGPARFDFSASTVTREFENSLKRLQTDYVDILQVHDLEFGSIERIHAETLPALRKLQQQGKARFIGITGYWPGLLAEVARKSPVDTVLNYCHLNLLMDDMNDVLVPTANELELGLINASPLHMGLLGGGPVPIWHPAPRSVAIVAENVVRLCRDAGHDPASVALAACLEGTPAHSTIMGFSSAVQVEAAVAALNTRIPQALSDQLDEMIKPAFNVSWPSGLLENQPRELAHAN